MAEGGGGDAGWWGWIQSAKEKVVSQSSEVLEFVKKDIDEFTKVVSEEASSVVSSTATTLKEKLRLDEEDSAANTMKKSVSGFLNHVAEVFTPPPDDGDQEAIVIRNHQPVILNRLQAATYAVSQDAATYLTEPEGEEAQYEAWLSAFDLEAAQAQLSDLLVNNSPLRHHYTTLVPAQVSHVVFWHRYFYKVKQLEAAEEKRKLLKERAEKMCTDTDLVWDEDEDFGGDIDIPEDVQARLLQDYEKECEETSRTRSARDTVHCRHTHCPADKEPHTSALKSAPTDITKLCTDVELLQELKVDLCKAAETSSKPSPSSTEGNEDEWEKVEAVDACSPPPPQPPAAACSPAKAANTKKATEEAKSEDWSWD